MRPSKAAGFGLFVTRPPSQVMPALLALLAGVLQAASLAWPLGALEIPGLVGVARGQPVWWLQGLAMAGLVLLLLRCGSARQAAWRGWLFALAWLSLTFGWLFTSMHTYGGLPAPLAVLAVLALAGVLALYYAAVCGLFRALARTNRALTAILFAALWLLAELARGQWLTGFGWGAVGYAQLDGPLASLIAWVGQYGVGFAVAVLAALLAQVMWVRSWRDKLGAATGMLVLLAAAQLVPPPDGATQGHLNVTLLQGNIAQNEKFEPGTGVPKALRWYGEQLQANRSSLVISPETAVPLLPSQLPDGYWLALQQRFASGEQAALVGMPLGSYTEGYTNSVVGLKPGQPQPWRYDKHHLVPFGEFIPPLFRWFTDLMAIPLGDFNRGGLPQPTFDWQGQRLATTICYENLFTEELAAPFADPQRAPTMLVNISNLGWFGEHLAMDQHLQIARMRALEFDRPFLLATNTGRTAIVNHRGEVTHTATPHTATVLHGQVEGRSGLTPYARWLVQWGLWPLWGSAVVLVLFGAMIRQQQPHRR
ncbi:apolipoprotein N-acyltransferase [Rhodoferax sp.]|uniref:apolipoprotein N-acyltransferase n=1 Tax=Rhodoferax sp. TaxID=50421 RepID=UPI002631F012|nr:apolipoprotein N-acyltransferase [Rhodoferax sp.]MDD2926052.1 apolipoprotein N-acyltransferase [Rhodoferax sp.]